MGQKKIMLLGGLRYLLPAIEAAHAQGYHVITADYLPGNVAHRYSDEYVNVSIIDKEAVLKAALEKRIDGIMSFACDPGVVSAAYVQEQMGLPSFGPYKSVEILQNKDKFRSFLREHGFNVPKARSYVCRAEALKDKDLLEYPVIVKPVDSAGSKGVCRANNAKELEEALVAAFKYSITHRIIIESFLEKRGRSSDTDCFSVDGQLRFVDFNAQYFDLLAANPYTPSAYSWPSTFTQKEERELTSELQRLISLLGMKTALFNVETLVAADGTPYIMELTPRAGGNRLSEMLRHITGVDLITAITRWVVGDPIDEIKPHPPRGHWAEIILHSNETGVFQGLEIDRSIAADVIEEDLWCRPGDVVNFFQAANQAIGTLILKFRNAEEQEKALATQAQWLKVRINREA